MKFNRNISRRGVVKGSAAAGAVVGGPVQVDGAEVRWAGRLDATVRVLVVRFRPPGGPGVACWSESSRCSSASPPS